MTEREEYFWERLLTELSRIADALERAHPAEPKAMKLDGQVGRPAEEKAGKTEWTEADIKRKFEMMMKNCRPIHKDAAQKAMVTAAAEFPGVKIIDWPAAARKKLFTALCAIDPMDDEIPF